MKIAFAHNVYDRFKTLKETINIERIHFPESDVFVSCNSYKNDDFFSGLKNTEVKYFLETPDHKIGCANGLLLSCNMSLEKEYDVLIFSHDDVRLNNNYLNIVMNNINDVFSNKCDIIYRNPEWISEDYAMMEVVYMNRKAVQTLFSNIELLKNENEMVFHNGSISPEYWFYKKLNNKGLNIKTIKYKLPNQNDYDRIMVETMGYYHLNNGQRGWKD